MDYLKDQQYYEDLYDLLTIKKCLESEKQPSPANLPDFEGKKLTPEQVNSTGQLLNNLWIYFTKGDRYRHRSETITDWIRADRKSQDFYDNTKEPTGIYCPDCGGVMHSDEKTLDWHLDGDMKVLFFFNCSGCKNRKVIFNNGEEWIRKPDNCPKCPGVLEDSYSRKGDKITTISKCQSCNYTNAEVKDLVRDRLEWEEKQSNDRKLLAQYREKFCLSQKEGSDFITWANNLTQLMEMQKQTDQKKVDPAYQKAMQLKKITIIELEKLVTEALAKGKYIKLSLDKPEIGKYVIVPFMAQDLDTFRKEYDSTNQLKKLLKKALAPTNWRLMSEGVTYRLGYVYGRLKGYEREEDLMGIVRG
jgi:DNA-directed RNA polymerase subunit M/transcription elongation factor TFIIS